MIKPRIKKHGHLWACTSGIYNALGQSPKAAYQNLIDLIKRHSNDLEINPYERGYRQIEWFFEQMRRPML